MRAFTCVIVALYLFVASPIAAQPSGPTGTLVLLPESNLTYGGTIAVQWLASAAKTKTIDPFIEVRCYQGTSMVWGNTLPAPFPSGQQTFFPTFGDWDASQASICVGRFMVWVRGSGALWSVRELSAIEFALQPS